MRAKGNFIDVENDPFAKQSSLVCLTQTCLESNELFQWPGRRCMPHASSGYGKGGPRQQQTPSRNKGVHWSERLPKGR